MKLNALYTYPVVSSLAFTMSPDSPSLDFSGQNLRGRSFKGQNLTGANFCRADLRGVNFSHAILRDTDFSGCRTGLPGHWRILWIIGFILLMPLLGMLSGLEGLYLGWLFTPEVVQDHHYVPAIAVISMIVVNLAIIARRGFLAALPGVIAMILLHIILSILSLIGLQFERIYYSTDFLANGFINAVITTICVAGIYPIVFAALSSLTNRKLMPYAFALFGSVTGVLLLSSGLKDVTAYFTASLGATIFLGLSAYFGWETFRESPRFASLKPIAVTLTTIGGTNFRHSNLSYANFSHANLKQANFRDARLQQTIFHHARCLRQASAINTILSQPQVCQLLVTLDGQGQSYVGCNLKGAFLTQADLQQADFAEADLSNANLSGSDLRDANLTKVQAIATNFSRACLTGACIESWNIDSTTQVSDIQCDFVYLRNQQQERRPSSGSFAPGDFTELFQEVLHTIDLIFHNGIDQKAFNYSLSQLQVENQGIPLSIRSLEKKGDGVVVVRVDVPPTADKPALHAEFTEHYQMAVQAIEAKYQAQLDAKDEQIALYRQQQSDWQEVLGLLKTQQATIDVAARPTGNDQDNYKLVVLQIAAGHDGDPVTLQISDAQSGPALQFTQGRLPAHAPLSALYQQWQTAYRNCFTDGLRLEVCDEQVTNISHDDRCQACNQMANQLTLAMNQWLNSADFRPIKERMLEQLMPRDRIQIVLQTEIPEIRCLPFPLWDFLQRYPAAEVALSMPDYERTVVRRHQTQTLNLLVILGDSSGIDLSHDRAILSNLPNTNVKFLAEPKRQQLNDHLWQQSWDILCFAGHSATEQNSGYMQINPNDRLTIAQLRHALRQAIAQGLQLAIFNSCDGLGLAYELADLHIPYTIVMREPVPDYVAQTFLKDLLQTFSSGQSLHQSVRAAREKLQGLEDRYPCASWLPIICQNPLEPEMHWPQ